MKNHTLYSILIALVVSIGGFLLGFDGAVISGAVPFYRISLGLSDNPFLLGLSVSSIVGGSIFGNFIAGMLSDKLGRKPTLIITSILFLIGSCGTAMATNITIFLLARVVGGMGVGIAILVAPIYIAEIAPPKQRGKLVTFNQLNIVMGLSVAYFSNYFILQAVEDPDLNWRWMLGVGLVPAIAYLLLLLLIPESPRWLIQKGKDEEGKAILVKAGGTAHAESEFRNIKNSLSSDIKEEKASYKELFSKKMQLVLIIGLALAFFQQISGINAVLYYAPLIFETAGGGRDVAFLQSVILGIVFIGGTVLSMFLIDRLGRKPLLIIGCSIMACSLMIAGISFYQARYTLTKNDIPEINKVLYNESVLACFTQADPANFKNDSIHFSNEKVFLYKNGTVISSLNLNTHELTSAKMETALLASTLSAFEGKTYSNEVAYFSSIKNDFKNLLVLIINKADKEGISEGDAFYKAISTKVKNKKLSTAEMEIIASDIAGQRFAHYKSVILSRSISINAVWVLIGILGFILGFSISLGPVMWTMLSEIFPNKLRGLAISVAGTFNAITSFFVASIFPVELDYLGSSTTYFIFSGFMFLAVVFVLKYIPETKGKTLEEIEKDLIPQGSVQKNMNVVERELIYAD